MNFRNRKLLITLRVILGLIFLASGISGLLGGKSPQGVPQDLVLPTQILWHMGILPMIKVTETISGLMLIFGLLPQLAAIFVAPICVGVIIVNANTLPSFVAAGVIISLLDIYLGYAYWDKYRALFERN